MTSIIARCVARNVALLIAASAAVFAPFWLAGSPPKGIPPETIAPSIVSTYWAWLDGLIAGEIAWERRSNATEKPLWNPVAMTAFLVAVSLAWASSVALVLSRLGLRHGAWWRLSDWIAAGAASLPITPLAFALIIVLGVILRWTPISGSNSLLHFVLPSVIVGLVAFAPLVRRSQSFARATSKE